MSNQRARSKASTISDVAAEIGSGLMPDNEQWINRFTIPSTSTNAVYVVAQRRTDQSWGCSCWGWRKNRHCKHLDRILNRLAALAEGQYDETVLNMLVSARTAYLDLDVTPIRLNTNTTKRLLDV